MVEAVFILPLMIVLLSGFMEAMWVSMHWVWYQHALDEAARWGGFGSSTGAAISCPGLVNPYLIPTAGTRESAIIGRLQRSLRLNPAVPGYFDKTILCKTTTKARICAEGVATCNDGTFNIGGPSAVFTVRLQFAVPSLFWSNYTYKLSNRATVRTEPYDIRNPP